MTKTKLIRFKGLSLDARDYASQGNAILGIRDSGKSYTGTFIAEKLMDAGVPFIAFDPIGVWRFLRVAAKGKGYPVVVAGGEHGDLPLTPQGAQEIVRAAMSAGVSVVFDLYDMELSKADWKRIVEVSVRTLLYENKAHGLRHIFIEEAAEFCPQRVGPSQGKVYAEIEKLARMGGNALLGYTLINQRAEEVNKAVLELCDGMFLHRQKGRNSLTALSKWLDIGGAAEGKDIIKSLPTLPQGECWSWPAGEAEPVRIGVPEKKTFHPDRRAMREEASGVAEHKTVNVSVFVNRMKSDLENILAQAEENDPDVLKARIKELEKQKSVVSIDPAALDKERRQGKIAGYREAVQQLEPFVDQLNHVGEQLNHMSRQITELSQGIVKWSKTRPEKKAVTDRAPIEQNVVPAAAEKPISNGADVSDDPLLQAALSVWPAKMTWGGLASMCGRKARGGYFNTKKRQLIDQGLVVEEGNLVVPTNPPQSPEGVIPADLLEQNLPQPAAKMFVAIRGNPGMDIETLADVLEMQPRGGHWNTGMSTLRRNGLITENGGLYIEPTLLGEAA